MYSAKEFGVRPRKSPGSLRKPNYWSTQSDFEPPPWQAWNSTKLPRSKSEERPPKVSMIPCNSTTVRTDFREYLHTSTLHGLRYIGEGRLTYFERFFWLTSFVCSLVCAAFFILNIYDKWRNSPMIVSVNPQNMDLQDIPFPALTICNVNQAKKSSATRVKQFGSTNDKKLLESFCTSNDSTIFDNSTDEYPDWDYQRSFLINVTQPCTEMLAECFWNSVTESCQELFNAYLTDEGLCCQFNVVHRKMMFRNPTQVNDLNLTFPLPAVNWNPEDGYPEDAPATGFPWRPLGTGTKHGLTLILDANTDEYYCATTNSAGFKILLHSPVEAPKVSDLGEIYGPGIEARVAIVPTIFDSQKHLATIDIKKRLCVFSNERDLVFFRTYTQLNCEMECESQTLLNKCNCALYYMPKNRSTRICGKADLECYSFNNDSKKQIYKNNCGCLPACTEIFYNERMSTAPLSKKLIKQHKYNVNKTAEYFKENMLIIHFYFEENSFIRYTKGEIFGLTEFLSNTGGLLGLCMGFSVMSAVEILYFITLKTLCKALAKRRRTYHNDHNQFTQ